MTKQMLEQARPVVKWVGGKSQLISALHRRLPPRGWGCYFEPFAGGGAFFFSLFRKGLIDAAVLNDANVHLMETYRVIRDEPDTLIQLLRQHARRHRQDGENYYYEVRSWDRQPEKWQQLSPAERAARFLYLNRTCYNGLYRVNRSGQFNVPAGRYKRPRVVFEQRIRAASAAFRNASLHHDDFETCCRAAEAGDLIYFDPPYAPLSDTADFTDYTAQGFDAADQRRLARLFTELAERGCHVLLSNSDTPLVRRLYEGRGDIHRVTARRSINTNGDDRGPVGELIIVHHPQP